MSDLENDQPDLCAPEAGEEDAGLIQIQDEQGNVIFRITPDYAQEMVDWLSGTGDPTGPDLIRFAREQAKPVTVPEIKARVTEDDWEF